MQPPPEWPRLIGSQLWQVTLLIPVLIIVIRLTCRKRSHLAYGLLLVALIKCITPPIFTSPVAVFGWMEGRQRASRQPPATVADGNSSPATTAPTEKSTPPVPPETEPPPSSEQVAQTTVPSPETVPPVESQSEAASPPPMPPPVAPAHAFRQWLRDLAERHVWLILAGLWVLGMAVWSVWLLISWLRLDGLWRLAEEAPGQVVAVVNRLSGQLGLRGAPEAMITDDASMPLAAGVHHRRVLLPRYILESATNDELELILAHELNHFRRWDTAIGLLQAVTQVVWWFHPCVWWLNRELRRYREQCCDEEVLARLNCRPQQYARCLLNVLELNERCSPALGLAGMSPFEVTSRRLRNIMRAPGTFRSHTPAWCWAILLCVGIVVLPGAAAPLQQGLKDEGAVIGRNVAPPAGLRAPDASATDEPAPAAPARVPAALPATLRYNWPAGTNYAYRLNIEVDHNDEVETISGTPSFHVRNSGDGQSELVVTADRLMSVRFPRPGRIPDFSRPHIPRFPRVGYPGPGFPTEHTLRIDARGRVISEQGESEPLPYLLGHLPSFLFEPLPETLQAGWRKTRTTEIRLSADEPDNSPFPIRPSSLFGEPEPEMLSAEETADYHVEAIDDAHILLNKDYSLSSIQTIDGDPRVKLTGETRITFDTARGIPTSISCDARMTEREGNVTTTWPIRATAELLPTETTSTGENGAPGAAPGEAARPNYAGPGSVPSSGLAVTDDTPLTPGQIVQVQWGNAWYPAEILGPAAGGQLNVHYRGWSDNWNEAVPRARIQLAHPESERL